MRKTQEQLILEEQGVLDELIQEMDETLMQLDKKLTYDKVQANKARSKCLPDAYGMLVSAEHDKMVVRQKIKHVLQGRDELYQTRLVLDVTDENGTDEQEIKIGLHTYLNGKRIFITTWKMPLCRHYILNNAAEEYDGVVYGKHGEKYDTHYNLKLKRQVNLFFDKVKSVAHFYPLVEEEMDQIISDEFLQELLNRRSGQEFKNIVFSIQKRQGEIIQTPYGQNLIVQGCAGSGKSMIMLHRLPIVLYDNSKTLDRNNMYIITPSIAYIQMAENMRIDLEIEDLKMGTLEQYYNYVLEKYGYKSDVYGVIKPYIKLESSKLAYVYSSRLIDDIDIRIKRVINKRKIDYKKAYNLLGMVEEMKNTSIKTAREEVRSEILGMQRVINANEKVLKNFCSEIKELFNQMETLSRMLTTRKQSIVNEINKKIDEERDSIKEKIKEIGKIENIGAHEILFKNRLNSIEKSQKNIDKLSEMLKSINTDESYFNELKNKSKELNKGLEEYEFIKQDRTQIEYEQQYGLIVKREVLYSYCLSMLTVLEKLKDPYSDYVKEICSECKKVEQYVMKLKEKSILYLPYEYLKDLIKSVDYFKYLDENIVHKLYIAIMTYLGQEPKNNGEMDALSCSPYLYIQILYSYCGAPLSSSENLITIDEAQNLAPEEFRLIKKINKNNVIFNLFGDVNQRVEGGKGIDEWDELSDIADFKLEHMRENYRNARQITEFCNKKFDMKMRAINLDGSGVHELHNEENFLHSFQGIFQKPQNVGLSCIIVKDKEEAKVLIKLAGGYANRIINLLETPSEIYKNKWNMISIDQAKGLEFETVFAVSGRMTENERYIAYTRALDELYVYEGVLKTETSTANSIMMDTIVTEDNSNRERKKRVKRKSKE